MSIEAMNVKLPSYQQVSSAPVKNTLEVERPKENVDINIEETRQETAGASLDRTVDKDSQNETSKAATDAVKKAVNELNRTSNNKTVQFGIHEETNRMTIKILDKDTRKVVKEFPAEKTLDLIAKAWEMAGMMFDEKR